MILFTYGTRPEALKTKPLIKEMVEQNLDHRVLFTGQHMDIAPDISNYKLKLPDDGDCNNRLNNIIKHTIDTKHIKKITHVLVQGDTTSALSLALGAFNGGLKVIHLEAGLRTYDLKNPYPEEANRQLISRISDMNLCPTTKNYDNLINERINPKKCFIVGNTSLDNLLLWQDKVRHGGNKVLITLHRRENHYWMKEWFLIINEIAKKYDYLRFIFPVHPNPNVQICKKFINAKNVELTNSMNHEELLNILVRSRMVITDSGGIQEECSFFNKICLTCRKVTERPEALSKSSFLVKTPLELLSFFDRFVNDYIIDQISPFGDGYSSQKIVKIFKRKIYV